MNALFLILAVVLAAGAVFDGYRAMNDDGTTPPPPAEPVEGEEVDPTAPLPPASAAQRMKFAIVAGIASVVCLVLSFVV